MVAYFNDGDGYLNYADLPRVMDYLIETRQVKPFLGVLLKPNDREKEYVFSSAYEQFVVKELVHGSMMSTQQSAFARPGDLGRVGWRTRCNLPGLPTAGNFWWSRRSIWRLRSLQRLDL